MWAKHGINTARLQFVLPLQGYSHEGCFIKFHVEFCVDQICQLSGRIKTTKVMGSKRKMSVVSLFCLPAVFLLYVRECVHDPALNSKVKISFTSEHLYSMR